jgi:DNA repair photolyase
MLMIVKEIESKSILTESKLPETDFCINPYVGCSHRCVYCYARFMKRFTAHTESWGEFVDIKTNSVELMQKKLKLIKDRKGVVLLGSVTDAYQPLERKYEITRGLLKELLQSELSVSILTKSDLVLRDIDILKQFKNITVGITITSTDEKACSVLEPGASSVERRLETLRKLHESGIHTYVFVGPIIPGITDLRAIFESVHGKTDEMWGEILNVKSGNWEDVKDAIEKNFVDALPHFLKTVRDKKYWDGVEEEFKTLCSEYGIPMVGFYRH